MYGLVLEGGGSRGSYQIGACKAINELGIEITTVAGTSVGALNGAMVVQDDVDKAYDIWHDINPDSVIKMPVNELEGFVGNIFKPDSLKSFIHRMKKVVADGGLNVEPLVELVKSVLDEDKIRKSSIGFGVVTVDITERKAVEIYKENIPAGQLADYVIASASFPVFKRAMIDGKAFIDGALYNVLPINMVSSRGCKDIIVVRTYGMGIKRRIDTSDLNILSISPTESLGSMLDFSKETSRKNLKMGYYDVYKLFRKLKGIRYYIKPFGDEKFFINYLTNMNDSKVQRLCNIFGFNTGNKRILFEVVVPKVADLLNLPANSSYEDVAIGLLEKAADRLGTERFRFYTVDELYNIVLQEHMSSNNDLLKESPGFTRNLDLLPRVVKDKLLNSILDEILMNENTI